MSLECRNVSYRYSAGTPHETAALSGLDLTIEDGEMLAVVGPTGSGKSTLLQVLAGLIPPTEGSVHFQGADIHARGYSKKELRQKIGMIFQYPEYQLFETTVLLDAAYGPKNLGCSEQEALERAREGLCLAGLPERYYEMSPFELSGGEKRRAAIAGVLAMNPEILIMDEPTAGLDPKGRQDLFTLISRLNREEGMTIVMVSSELQELRSVCDRIAIVAEGKVVDVLAPDASDVAFGLAMSGAKKKEGEA